MIDLKILKDDPAFSSGSSDDDAFNHQAVSNVLFRILEKNDPPLTIGLFGGWGVGKSSIINLLKNECLKKPLEYSFVYFNAWAYSGDSFRREFLLKIVKDLINDEAIKLTEFKRISKLNYAKILEEEEGITLHEIIKKARSYGLWTELKERTNFAVQNIKLTDTGLINIIITLTFFVCALSMFVYGSIIKDSEFQRWGVVSFLLSAASFFAPKFENVFVLKRREVFDAKLIFPEQFEKEYDALLNRHATEIKKVIVIIDDLDRCDSDTIKDILVTLKNYLGINNKSIFIVPIDDSAVVRMFKGENINFGYEQLRKYFSVSLRIPVIHTYDILDFAKQKAKQFGIPPDVVFIAAAGYCNDARKIKHFLNLYKIKFALAEERSSRGLLFGLDLESIQTQIAKITVLEYQYPEFYTFVSKYPDELKLFTDIARGSELPKTFNKFSEINEKVNSINDLWRFNPGLKDFLINTYDVSIEDFDILSKLKISNQESSLNDLGPALRNAIVNGITLDLNIYIKNDLIKGKDEEVVDAIIKNYDIEFTLKTQRAINIGLELLNNNILNTEAQIRLFKITVGFVTNNKIEYKINENNYLIFLDNFKYIKNFQIHSLHEKFSMDIFVKEKYFDKFDNILNHKNFADVFKVSSIMGELFDTVSLEWYSTMANRNNKEKFLLKIKNVKLTKDERVSLGFNLPSQKLFEIFINDIIIDPDDKDVSLNELLIENIINDNNNVQFGGLSHKLYAKIQEMINNNITLNEINLILKQAFKLILEMPYYLNETIATFIRDSIENNYDNFTNEEKEELLFVILYVYISLIKEENEIEATNTFEKFSTKVKIFSFEQLEGFITKVKEFYDNEELNEILTKILNLILEKISVEYKENTEDILKISKIILVNNTLVDSSKFNVFINNLVLSEDSIILKFWKDFIIKAFESLSEQGKFELLNRMTVYLRDPGVDLEVRKEMGEHYKGFLKIISISQGEKYYKDVLLFSYMDDDVAIKYIIENYEWYKDRFGNGTLKTNITEILENILSKEDLSKYDKIIENIILDVKNSVNINLKNKIVDKILIDLPNSNLNIQHRMSLLLLTNLFGTKIDKKELLSETLYNYKETGDNSDLKSKTWEMYSKLISEKIIKEYIPPKIEENDE